MVHLWKLKHQIQVLKQGFIHVLYAIKEVTEAIRGKHKTSFKATATKDVKEAI